MKKIEFSLLIVMLISSCSMLSIESTASEVNHFSMFPTETITHRPSETITPTKTLMPSPTQDESWQTVLSPDGKLVAKAYEYRGHWHSFIPQVIEVQDLEGEVIWAVPFQGELPRSDPHSTMEIVGWSPDSTVLYFYYSWAYDGGYTLFDGHDLQMLEIDTGELRELLTDGIISFSFTPDMSSFAYTNRGRIGIYDIATGDSRSVVIRSDKIAQSGHIHWSPSGEGLVFTILVDEGGTAREIYMDVESMGQKVLFDDIWIESYYFDDWTQIDGLRYIKSDFENGKFGPDEVVVVDIHTTELLIQGTPTPRP